MWWSVIKTGKVLSGRKFNLKLNRGKVGNEDLTTFPDVTPNYKMSNFSTTKNIRNIIYQHWRKKGTSKAPNRQLELNVVKMCVVSPPHMKYSDAWNQMHFRYLQSSSAPSLLSSSMEVPNNSCFSFVNFPDEYTGLSRQIWMMNADAKKRAFQSPTSCCPSRNAS